MDMDIGMGFEECVVMGIGRTCSSTSLWVRISASSEAMSRRCETSALRESEVETRSFDSLRGEGWGRIGEGEAQGLRGVIR